MALLCRPRRGRGNDDLPLVADPGSHARRLLQGLSPQQLGGRGDLRRHCRHLRPRMNDETGSALTRFEFASGALRGSQLMLYPRCLVHRSESHLETIPLARVTALRVSFERHPRQLGWGVALVVFALVMLAIASPMGSVAHGAAQEMATSAQGVARTLFSLFRLIEMIAALLPALALACALGGAALGV